MRRLNMLQDQPLKALHDDRYESYGVVAMQTAHRGHLRGQHDAS